MSDTTKKAQPWDKFVRVIGHVASSMLMTSKGNLPEVIIDICFGESLINKFMHFAFISSLADNERYISNCKKKVKFTDDKGTTKGFGYTDEDRQLNAMALAWEKIAKVIAEDGFLVYGGKVELRFSLMFTTEERTSFEANEDVNGATLAGLNRFLSTWFSKSKDKDFNLVWTHVPLDEDFYVLSVQDLTLRQKYTAKK